MASVKIERIASYSSADPLSKYPADNLLKFGSKWKCKTPGEGNATVILQLDQPRVIETIDLGNEHSAFIQVLVGRAASNDYQILLPASSFMSPLESDQSTNTNRVRMFTKQDFLKPAADEKWDRIKIVCSQPFNNRVQYGLSFVVLKQPEEKPKPVTFGSFELQKEEVADNGSSSIKLGRFALKKEENDDVKVGHLFAKRKELSDKKDVPSTNSTAGRAEVNGSLLKPTLSPAQQKTVAKKVVPKQKDDTSKTPKADFPVKQSTQPLRQSSPPPKPKPVTPKVMKPQVQPASKNTPGRPPGKQNPPPGKKPTTPSDKVKRPSPVEKKPALPTKKARAPLSKPFDKLLEGVTIVISGYVNPTRALLRSKALDMGAKYKQDWDSSCTHLICAFKNTPKFKQVQGHGCIVQKDWIEQCHARRARLPWRRFALDVNDFQKPVSEDEIVESSSEEASTTRDLDPPNDFDMEMASSSGCQAESGSDTEDEIERIEAKQKTPASSRNPYLSDTDVDSDDERPDTSNLPMPPLP